MSISGKNSDEKCYGKIFFISSVDKAKERERIRRMNLMRSEKNCLMALQLNSLYCLKIKISASLDEISFSSSIKSFAKKSNSFWLLSHFIFTSTRLAFTVYIHKGKMSFRMDPLSHANFQDESVHHAY